jgi:hypothetical protein
LELAENQPALILQNGEDKNMWKKKLSKKLHQPICYFFRDKKNESPKEITKVEKVYFLTRQSNLDLQTFSLEVFIQNTRSQSYKTFFFEKRIFFCLRVS